MQFRHQMKHLVKNTPLPVVFSTLFSVFYLVMTHCVECLKHYINKPYNLRMDEQMPPFD